MSFFKKIGILNILAGLLFNPWLIGQILSPDGKITSPHLVMFILLIELFFVTMGLLLLVKSEKLNGKTFAYTLAMIVLILVSIEIGLHVIDSIRNSLIETGSDKILALSIYKDKPWAEQLFKEHSLIEEFDYEPLLGWKTREFQGEFINIDKNGVRKTFNPTDQITEKDSIYMFGGSTIWGEGARDDYTIPSYLSKFLNRQQLNLMVKNYGERGYLSNQSILRLTILLKNGRRPQMVIFYEGVNDVVVAAVNGKTGVIKFPRVANYIAQKRLSPLKQIAWFGADMLNDHFMIYKAIKKISAFLFQTGQIDNFLKDYDEQKLKQLSQDIASYYLKSLQFVDRLSKAYGFKYKFFWQPVIYTKNYLTEEERSVDNMLNQEKFKKLYLHTNKEIDRLNFPNLYNLSQVLNDKKMTLYKDFCHLSEEGNEIVAAAIFKIISKEFQK